MDNSLAVTTTKVRRKQSRKVPSSKILLKVNQFMQVQQAYTQSSSYMPPVVHQTNIPDSYFQSEAEKHLNYSTIPSQQLQYKINKLIHPYNKKKIVQKCMDFEKEPESENTFYR